MPGQMSMGSTPIGELAKPLYEGGGSIADVAGDLVESGNFDDFQSDVIESEVTEAAADEVWDDLGS